MRFVSFAGPAGPALGLVQDEEVADLGQTSIETLIAQGFDGAAAAAAKSSVRHKLADLDLLPPTRGAGKIICLGLNYIDHAAESGHKRPEYPVLFMRGATSLVAHGQPILRPACSDKLDYEGELVAVVGKRARHVARADALSFIAGYSIFNDASIRDYQLRTPQWTIGKNFDATGGYGPVFVTADELPPGAAGLKIQTRLNGQVLQEANTTDMIFGVAETVALLTECLTLEPGDLLVMGTPSGVGGARNPQVWMKPGDVCEVEIEGIGILSNPIAQEAAARAA
ncbi:MAG: fumarylacetoacetate hydrolase family protein [Alphaproteobacteria bacterium]|jgi:2-keto-4-pentenoate hydratase/2-oxohepta-3-ene-1,7-dioic acid hydratase in catechol pathway|nr:fumarylacetoacetate hydrolase family protein [Alphaproteobacteria bacterium]